jgi:hypothetical protein
MVKLVWQFSLHFPHGRNLQNQDQANCKTYNTGQQNSVQILFHVNWNSDKFLFMLKLLMIHYVCLLVKYLFSRFKNYFICLPGFIAHKCNLEPMALKQERWFWLTLVVTNSKHHKMSKQPHLLELWDAKTPEIQTHLVALYDHTGLNSDFSSEASIL